MNLSVNGLSGFSVFSQRFGTAGMLKSTQDKLERQQKAQSQIEFFENQKENLKHLQFSCNIFDTITLHIFQIFFLIFKKLNLTLCFLLSL